MKPIYTKSYISNSKEIFQHLLNDLTWLEMTEARKEYFMSIKPLSYTYGIGKNARTYSSEEFSKPIEEITIKLNKDFDCNYDVCFLNRYDTQKNALGYHADDSPEMNPNHDIAVISFGAERQIWWKLKEYKGELPSSNKQLLHDGSLFIMPAGFQKDYLHKIPRADSSCGIRISLTFRNYLEL